ncbi:hypothetical protein RFI_01042 [Reticulomyxa filosa]|uniref:Transmembrane protein n=1 Tax=Reticulomyxa filosa TaxID=46433 RepID=X6PCT1_RETFI|nr:hypothetical protein RFI_01042 [Reticulomyxa filosa]|eukprot:ETO36021.1 hypothetical protein RFI_01042 [Reticulomyxa filosa]
MQIISLGCVIFFGIDFFWHNLQFSIKPLEYGNNGNIENNPMKKTFIRQININHDEDKKKKSNDQLLQTKSNSSFKLNLGLFHHLMTINSFVLDQLILQFVYMILVVVLIYVMIQSMV